MDINNKSALNFEDVFNSNKSKIYNLAYRMMGNEHDAQDIVQDTFYLAYKNIHNFRNESSIYTWLYRICTNECLKQRKNRKIKHMELLDGDFEYSESDNQKDWINNPENVTQVMALTNYIRSECHNIVLHSLTKEQRIVYILRVIMEMSYKQISEILDISENVVKARLNRARNKLLNHFEENCNWFKHRNDNCCLNKLGYALSMDVDILNRLDEITFDYSGVSQSDNKKEFIDYIYKQLPLISYNY